MIKFEKDYKYTVIYTTCVKEIQRDYPNGKVILLEDDGEWKLVAVKERR